MVKLPNKSNSVEIGFIKKKFSHQGKFILQLHSSLLDLKKTSEYLFLELDNCLIPYKIIELNKKNSEEYLIQLKNIEDENMLDPFLNCNVWIEKSFSKKIKNKEFDLQDLIGYSVIEGNDKELGILQEISENKFQQLMKVVNENKKEVLIPLIEDFFVEIDSKNKVIYLELPEGLSSMNE